MDEEFYSRYQELYNLLSRAYFDKCIIDVAKRYNVIVSKEKKALPLDSNRVFQHYCDIAKSDLALILWMITDSKEKSNTLITLKSYLYKSYNISIKMKFSKQSRKLINDALSNIRNKALAHNDVNKSCEAIHIDDLFLLLNESRLLLNEMCCSKKEKRIVPMTGEELLRINLTAKKGLGTLLDNSYIDISGEK